MAEIGGALFVTFIVFRLAGWIWYRALAHVEPPPKRANLAVALATVATVGLGTIAGAYGLADGGAPQYARAFLPYSLAGVAWGVAEWIKVRDTVKELGGGSATAAPADPSARRPRRR